MPRPNFVFVMTDTQGANIVGCYGRPEMRTPCIDRLAERGIRFERAYSMFPVCTPARAGIFTGLYPSFNGSWANELPLGANIKTMGQRFRDDGNEAIDEEGFYFRVIGAGESARRQPRSPAARP